LWHPTDSAVKPIVANRRIERLPEAKYEAKALPFEPLSLPALLATDQKELEAFLTHIYRAVASAAPLKDKINVLAYFESLCTDTNAANVLINSSLSVLFVRMMRNSKAPLLRVRLASVLGLLVRHATFISEELASTQVVDILTEALRDKNERIRRR
jgi:serine/threonine-protein kinase ULK4